MNNQKTKKRVLKKGVEKATILDGRVAHSLLLELFSPDGIGTLIY